ncbi:amine oxidase [flavin-containing] B [Venturia canescens]|uniref:amine oxidase [flavin-containing] B n=1 Tax=Venturia canescens TaxID=32260 RepID=UPI001C9C3020|nr:amine oxidase [flavin-containing] B-like [Venturia canescens]
MTTSVALENNFDVVIVGSGLTGLTAAYYILKRNVGLNVLILEKNDAPGGRILLGTIGQAYYGSYSQKNIVKLLTELNIPTDGNPSEQQRPDNQKDFSFLTTTDVSRFASAQVYHFLKLLNSMTTGVRFAPDRAIISKNVDHQNLGKMSLKELIERTVSPGRPRGLCESLLRVCCPGIESLDEVSALWFLVMLTGAGGVFAKFAASLSKRKRFFIEGGFELLVKKLEQRIIDLGGNIRRSENVVKIEDNDRAILVTTAVRDERKRFKSECIIVAVPPPSNAQIIAETKLPKSFLESQKFYQNGRNTFFRASYEREFWTASSFVIEATLMGSNLRTIYAATEGKRKSAVLGGFSSANNPNEIIAALGKSLRRLGRVSECMSCETSDVSPVHFLRPCSLEYHVNPLLTSSSAQRVQLAASEFASQWPGTVDGAIEAGERAARAILSRTRPQALGINDLVEGPSLGVGQEMRGPLEDVFSHGEAIGRAHKICLGLNVCLFFSLLVNAY